MSYYSDADRYESSLSAVYEVREILWLGFERFPGVTTDYIYCSLLAGVQQQVHELVSGLGIGNEQGRRTVLCTESL